MRRNKLKQLDVVEAIVLIPIFLIGLSSIFRTGAVSGFLEYHNKLFASIQSIVTATGVVLAAWWFITRRQRYPRAEIKNWVTHRPVAPGWVWIHIRTDITNRGNVLLEIVEAETWIQRITPLHREIATAISSGVGLVKDGGSEISWTLITDCNCQPDMEVEPSESDYIAWDFIVPDEYQTIRIFTHISNETKRTRGPIGWTTELIYDMMFETPSVVIAPRTKEPT